MSKKNFLIILLLSSVMTLSLFLYDNNNFYRAPSSDENAAGSEVETHIHTETIHLLNFEKDHKFYISNTNAYSLIEIADDIENLKIDLQLTCDQNFQLASKVISSKIKDSYSDWPLINQFHFRLKNKKNAHFLLSKDIRNCQLTYTNLDNESQKTEINIKSESSDYPWMTDLLNYQENCQDNQKIPQLSCSHQVQKLTTLETPESGFIAKAEMLLGQKLDPSFIANQNPYAQLDFSKAPRLKAIFIATLVYRADFYGTVISRLLKYHAEHGTIIHLMTTGYMMLEKDKKLLRNLASENGNFRLQEFKYYDPKYNLTRPLRYIDDKYRDMHIKLFITLSDNDENNAVVFGGRNIHDGFLFKTMPDYSKYPELVQYGTDDDFVHWNDFEMKITSKEIATMTAAHLLKFWNRDTVTQKMDDFFNSSIANEISNKIANENSSQVRHFISVPYNDGHALEKLYISLIDSAEHSIKISSPYLRPTDKIMQALERAIARNVDITIQTRVSLIGDTQAWLYEEVNKESINKLFDKVKVYEWKENSILHSKFILIDGKAGFIGSVNLSRRSFIQDVENGYIIRSESFIKKMDTIFNSYIEKSQQITVAEKRKFFPSLLIQLLKNQF